jgi:hypothetical protein
MSSVGFSTILDKALDLAAIKCGGNAEIARVANEIKRRADLARDTNTGFRQLFVEPASLAQEIGVPTDDVSMMADELCNYGVLHHWVRVLCPNVRDDGYRVTIETDDPEELKGELLKPCRHCGQIHDHIDWGDVETVYALNLESKPERPFDLAGFF